MTMLLALTAVVVCLGGVLLLALRAQVGCRRPASSDEIETPVTRPSPREVYGPMKRLFAKADFDFLASQAHLSPLRIERWRRERLRALQLYLRQVRRDFEQVYGTCRLIAHRTQHPTFATQLTKVALRFYSKLVLLHLYCLLRLPGRSRIDVFDLVRPIENLREALADMTGNLLARPNLVADGC